MFPSPCGEKVGINTRRRSIPILTNQVSVPLRGKGRDQHSYECQIPTTTDQDVSVPLRGKGRDQLQRRTQSRTSQLAAFPSPCGEKVGINIAGELSLWKEYPHEFPSPCGEKVGINGLKGLSPAGLNVRKDVSVPLRGKGRDQPYPRKSLNS